MSSVTGQGLDLLRKFLNTIPKNLHQQQDLEQQLAEFRVDEIYSVPEVGTVVGGLLTHGIISEGDELLVGPRNDCLFSLTKVVSIHRFRSPCRLVKAMQSATLALKEVERTDIRKVRIGKCGLQALALCTQKKEHKSGIFSPQLFFTFTPEGHVLTNLCKPP